VWRRGPGTDESVHSQMTTTSWDSTVLSPGQHLELKPNFTPLSLPSTITISLRNEIYDCCCGLNHSFYQLDLNPSTWIRDPRSALLLAHFVMSRLWCTVAVATLFSLASGEAYTSKHEAGRCAIRGSCGGSGFFSPALPCLDNSLAKEPDDDVREQLVGICGEKWNTGPICCESDQV
jgi:Niemann-Pick C1 N terminus